MLFYGTNLSSYELGLEDLCLQNEPSHRNLGSGCKPKSEDQHLRHARACRFRRRSGTDHEYGRWRAAPGGRRRRSHAADTVRAQEALEMNRRAIVVVNEVDRKRANPFVPISDYPSTA